MEKLADMQCKRQTDRKIELEGKQTIQLRFTMTQTKNKFDRQTKQTDKNMDRPIDKQTDRKTTSKTEKQT